MFKHDSQSIQQLMAAEKRAEEKMNQARKRKIMRLKQAKEEAQAEIKSFRDEKEKEFKAYESKFLGSRESKEIQIEKETEKALIEMQKMIKLNKSTIIDYLIDQIFSIDCNVHENFRQDDY